MAGNINYVICSFQILNVDYIYKQSGNRMTPGDEKTHALGTIFRVEFL